LATLDEVRAFWNAHPVGDRAIQSRRTRYDYFREFDNLREHPDVEPYELSNRIHGYETAGGLRVLDYGCGNGYVLGQYARNGADVYGVDIAPAALQLTHERFSLIGLNGTFQLTEGDVVPFESEMFDIVCSMGVLHHVDDATRIVRELHRVLKPGGRLIVMFYNRRSFRYHVTFRYRSWFGPRAQRGRPLGDYARMNDGNDNPCGLVYTQTDIRRLLSDFVEHQFLVSKLSARELGLWLPVVAPAFDRLIPPFIMRALASAAGWNLYCTARKPANSRPIP
jgi:SAM-dependent methyltransferase